MFKSQFVSRCWLFCSLCAFPVALLAQPSSFELNQGVIVDKNADNIYVINPTGGLDAVAFHTGLVNWHTDVADLPIMVSDGQLLAQQETHLSASLSLTALNTVNGELMQVKHLPLPDNISAPIAAGLDTQFNLKSNFDNNPHGDILWTYQHQLAQGMVAENAPAKVNIYGLIGLDSSRSLDNANMQLLSTGHANTNKAIEGKFLPQLQLADNARQFNSIDGQHILVSTLNANNVANTSEWKKYTWDIYTQAGQLVGSTRFSASYSPFMVKQKTLVFISQPHARVKNNKWSESPLSVLAVSLDSGQLIWDKQVRDLKYYGPFPH